MRSQSSFKRARSDQDMESTQAEGRSQKSQHLREQLRIQQGCSSDLRDLFGRQVFSQSKQVSSKLFEIVSERQKKWQDLISQKIEIAARLTEENIKLREEVKASSLKVQQFDDLLAKDRKLLDYNRKLCQQLDELNLQKAELKQQCLGFEEQAAELKLWKIKLLKAQRQLLVANRELGFKNQQLKRRAKQVLSVSSSLALKEDQCNRISGELNTSQIKNAMLQVQRDSFEQQLTAAQQQLSQVRLQLQESRQLLEESRSQVTQCESQLQRTQFNCGRMERQLKALRHKLSLSQQQGKEGGQGQAQGSLRSNLSKQKKINEDLYSLHLSYFQTIYLSVFRKQPDSRPIKELFEELVAKLAGSQYKACN